MRPIAHIIIPVFENDPNKSIVPVLKDIVRLGKKLSLSVLVITNNTDLESEAGAILAQHQWDYLRSPETMPTLKFRRWCYESLSSLRGKYFFQIYPYAVLVDRFFDVSVATWENITDHSKSVLNLTGVGKLPKRKQVLKVVQAGAPDHTFITDKTGLLILTQRLIPSSQTPVWEAQGQLTEAWGTTETLEVFTEDIQKTRTKQLETKLKKATFFVATHNRPELLTICLKRLQNQRVPEGWSYNILVSGMIDDLGKAVAQKAGVKYIISASPTVTSKLNLMLGESDDTSLIMKADDDDIQPPDRLEAAVDAYRAGAAWSGVGQIYFYDIYEDRVMNWKGRPEWGLIGTSMNYDAKMLRTLKGWPSRVKGEDGALANLIKALRVPFVDVTDKMGALICCQHGNNLYPRPVVEINGRTSRGGFVIHGEGSLLQSSIPDSVRKILQEYKKHQKPPAYTPPLPKRPFAFRRTSAKQQPIVGIGVCSFNKPEALQRWSQNLSLITQMASKAGFQVEAVLSTGDTNRPLPMINNIPCIHRTNLGVAWVKNNALQYLFEKDCDYFFLVEDDCNIPDWEFFHKYIQASQSADIHHMMYGPIVEWPNTWQKTGEAKNIAGFQFLEYRRKQKPHCTPGVITFHTRHALEVSGGMDMRFVGRGHGHKEWTDRTVKLLQLQNEYPFEHPLWFLDIPENQNVTFESGPSRGMNDKKLIARNKNLLTTASPQPCYDFLWADVEFPKVSGPRGLWSYLNGRYPYSLLTDDPEASSCLAEDQRLFHAAGVSHPQDPISICISLKNRIGMLEGFVSYLNQGIDNPALYELVITDFQSNDCDVYKTLQKINIPYKVIPAEGYFSRGKGLHMAALCAQHDLLMFFDIDMAVSSPLYWAWVRRHTSAQKVMFPICYGLHKDSQMIIQGNTKNPAYSNGFWRVDGFGMAAFHREAYLKVGGWDHRIARWGGEDNDIYWHCKHEKLELFRKKSLYLFHRWHPDTKDYKDPYGDKRQKTLQGTWRDPMIRGTGKPDPTKVLEGYDD